MVSRKRHDRVNWLGLLVLAIWLVLVFARGNFWRCRDRDDLDDPPEPAHWPSVVAVVPARDEAALIGESLGSLLAQDYPGEFHVVLADDQSGDGTADKAREAAAASSHPERLVILPSASAIFFSPTPTSCMRRKICAPWWRGPRPALMRSSR
jgi:cellulose synthase/poly-beta-1,6-N-acetylglucosamine synthase-like glycosyltransferase